MKTQPIDADAFMQAITPALAAGDADGLAAAARRHAEPMSLCPLLANRRVEVRRVTAGGVGADRYPRRGRVPHPQPPRPRRAGRGPRRRRALVDLVSAAANRPRWRIFGQGLDHLQDEAYDRAVEAFARSTRIDPEFAEAHNQSAIAHYLAGRWRQSIADTRRALARMPTHFGAMAGLGHCHAHLQQFHDAAACYRRALAINPRLVDLPRAVADLQRKVGDTPGPRASRKSVATGRTHGETQ